MREPTQRRRGAADQPTWSVARTVHATEVVEDAIHVVVVLLLAMLGLILIVDTVRHVAVVLTSTANLLALVLGIFEETLLLFIVAELLHTVAIALRHHGALDPEPFLVVGMVAGIRQVLILTAEAEQSFRWNPEGIQLLILMALILVMATTRTVWRLSPPSGIGALEKVAPTGATRLARASQTIGTGLGAGVSQSRDRAKRATRRSNVE